MTRTCPHGKLTTFLAQGIPSEQIEPLTVVVREVCSQLIIQHYIPSLRDQWLIGFDEMRGIALGSGVPLERVVFLNVWEDLAAIGHIGKSGDRRGGRPPQPQDADESISAFFSPTATVDGETVLAHSLSSSKKIQDENLMVYLEIRYPEADFPTIFTVVEAGMISGCGMNSAGLAVTANCLWSTDDHLPQTGRGFYFPVTCMQRFLLESSDIHEAQAAIHDMRRHASKHVLLADESRSLSLELGPEHVFTHHARYDSKAKVHTNHFQSFEAFQWRRQILDRYQGKSSQARLYRLEHLIDDRVPDRMSRQDIVDVFSDHNGDVQSICQHNDEGCQDRTTVSFVMFNPKRKTISACKGPPCEGQMMHFTLETAAEAAARKQQEEAARRLRGSGGMRRRVREEMDMETPRSRAPSPPNHRFDGLVYPSPVGVTSSLDAMFSLTTKDFEKLESVRKEKRKAKEPTGARMKSTKRKEA
ncbi:acyl-coenzyme A:6-aminopenicillanic acid acyl-transferase-domain-containing protein [Chaetomium strumarium]|uniref:Acyl-coenzyme A:6-aminopenicillanic acid acyl-transferase-domain-containing protein n=1 Tax=Chaetomium strumarium TaxID=1170767 RepID=A0AAJ0GXG4_9PEZI|nr:acyl-coenzyme A:6-aminopenicillanic acid acyl-transferase-domain-containing protein [Chaetomium strumarium]